MNHYTIYLASSSPRRYDILHQLGYQIYCLPSDIDETPKPNEPAREFVQRMANEKNRRARQLWLQQNNFLPAYPIISADTAVVLDQQILGKPHDAQDAMTMLQNLSDRRHQVLSAVCVYWQKQEYCVLQTSEVTFIKLTNKQIDAYVHSGEPLDKAGAYGIQGLGGTFISHIEGSFTGIMGLPVYETTQLLSKCGFPPL